MQFLIGKIQHQDIDKLKEMYDAYYNYLESIKIKLPKNTYEFAKSEWHYDHEDHRCPHDGWIESITISEISSGERSEIRNIEINICLLNAYHDGHIKLKYRNVEKYTFEKTSYKNAGLGHEDWLIDEITLSENSNVVHDIYFSSDSHWTIECEDIVYQWEPFKD